MKPNKLIIIFLFMAALSLFFVTDSAFAQVCTPGTYSSCFASNCCTTGFPTTICGVTCPLCPQRSSPYEKGCYCEADGTWICDICCTAGCFSGETRIEVGSGEGEGREIEDLEPGEIVSSFDPETGEVKEGTVSDVQKLIREGYYELETESGKKVKVTAEHPFLALKSEKNQESTNQASNIKNQLENILSNTLTYQVITSLQARVNEILH